MWYKQITLENAIEYLNSLVLADSEAIANLIEHRVDCNASLAEHPFCQVDGQSSPAKVGMLGILNGFFGVRDGDQYGAISAEYGDDGRLERFIITPEHKEP